MFHRLVLVLAADAATPHDLAFGACFVMDPHLRAVFLILVVVLAVALD